MSNTILLLLFIGIIVIFIENRIGKNKIIHIHFLIIFLFTFYGFPLPQKLAIITILYWFFKILVNKSNIKTKIITPYTLKFIYLGLILFCLEFITTIRYPTLKINIIFYFFAILWPILIIATIKKFDDVVKFIKFFILSKFIETCLLGLIIYFFFYDEAQTFIYFLKEISGIEVKISDLGLSEIDEINQSTKRLYSIFTSNAADASYFLFVIFCLTYPFLYIEKNYKQKIILLIITTALLLTLTRTAIILAFVYYLFYNKTIFGAKKIITSVIISIIVLLIGYLYFADNLATDARLQSNENSTVRIEQYTSYLTSLGNLEFFNGVPTDISTLSNKLDLKNEISSESYFLNSFVVYGIFGGSSIAIFVISVIINFNRLKKKLKRYISTNTNILMVSLLLTLYLIIMFAGTTLLVNNTYLYIHVAIIFTLFNTINPTKLSEK